MNEITLAQAASLRSKALEKLECWPGYSKICTLLEQLSDIDCYLVGGSVRDIVLKNRREPNDFDFLLGGRQIATFISSLAESGRMIVGPLGSPRWFPSATSHVYCDLVSIERVDHGFGKCSSLSEAVGRWDFTGDAIALNLRNGRIVDTQGGYSDLEHRVMRAVRFDHPPIPVVSGVRITWQASAWFRILHYAAKLGLSIEPDTLAWLQDKVQCIELRQEFESFFFPPDISCLEWVRTGSELRG